MEVYKEELQELLKTALKAEIDPLKDKLLAMEEENKALKEEMKVLQFEKNNEEPGKGSFVNGIYQGRPDSARHVTLKTRPVAEAPHLYSHVTEGVKAR
jgi:hypothetical protein